MSHAFLARTALPVLAFLCCCFFSSGETVEEGDETGSSIAITSLYEPPGCRDQRSPQVNEKVHIHYTGSIHGTSAAGEPGAVFLFTVEWKPLRFRLGRRDVVPGLEMGIRGMCIGERRSIVVPPSLGFGEHGWGRGIPGNATLQFDIELRGIEEDVAHTHGEPETIFNGMDSNENDGLTIDEMQHWFEQRGRRLPATWFDQEDKNGDGIVTWEEFSGQKLRPREKTMAAAQALGAILYE
eukprot:TRINITY_DN58457_c0_g1_i1.p1 TRINITY_DN58457_c0_g1~~TRINITY_DN58457_c0_g1_i1.p1  ORF type:complete len:239 (+),score=29.66 TRINITY_DN58457_c0_g1_i1:81-797(+)